MRKPVWNRRVVPPGTRFGMLTVLEEAEPGQGGKRRFACLCDCGCKTEVRLSNLRRGSVRSCGCYQSAVAAARHTTHGGRWEALYTQWRGIKRRCYNPKDPAYKNYGGRGVSMASEWLTDYAAFKEYILEALGPRPEGKSLDRIDNEGHYEPGNLRWSTDKEQNRNRRLSRSISANGATKLLCEWAEESGIPAVTITSRIDRYGWAIEEAVSIKPGEKRWA